MKKQIYSGTELKLFSKAYNWKAYYSSTIRPFIKGNILEVGAGIGSTTKFLCQSNYSSWTCLEPDSLLANEISSSIIDGSIPQNCTVKTGTIKDLDPDEMFETIIYIDVLEHIKDDRSEVRYAAQRLKRDGNLIVLAPAHQKLFTPFDESIGHYRRYNKTSLSALTVNSLELRRICYLDSVGLIASLGNYIFLKSQMPTEGQIMIWDRIMVPMSKLLDGLIRYSIGKSVLGIWKKKS